MRWWHFGIASASVGIGLLAFAGDVAAQKGTKPKSAIPAAESADTLNAEVVRLYQAGRYSDAVPLARRALAIREKALGPDHPDVGTSLNNLAGLYVEQGRYAEAEPLYKRSLAIREKALSYDHPDVAASLNLAELYRAQGRDAEAEPLYKRSLAIFGRAYLPRCGLGLEVLDLPATGLPKDIQLGCRLLGQGRKPTVRLDINR
jgi:tetratricopeptide (TPR) repeat protein